MISLRLITGEDLDLHDIETDKWEDALNKARRLNVFISVHSSDDRKLGLNPHHIMYWELRP